jgi:hypothetical protein
MGEALVGAMVAAMRRANRDWAEASRARQPQAAPRPEGAAWGYLVRPSLMPTVYSPSGDASGGAPGAEVAARKV